jgi:hypothetical protein
MLACRARGRAPRLPASVGCLVANASDPVRDAGFGIDLRLTSATMEFPGPVHMVAPPTSVPQHPQRSPRTYNISMIPVICKSLFLLPWINS